MIRDIAHVLGILLVAVIMGLLTFNAALMESSVAGAIAAFATGGMLTAVVVAMLSLKFLD